MIVFLLSALAASQIGVGGTQVVLVAPEPTPRTVADAADFPFLTRIAGTSLVRTARIDEPLEVKPASADNEAMLAGMSFVEKSYDAPIDLSDTGFVSLYRDALVLHGWRILDQPPATATENEPHVITLSAHYAANGRDLYARISRAPDGAYAVGVADVGAEDWGAMLDRACHVPVFSVHFKHDLTLNYEESRPTLEKLAAVVRSKPNVGFEIQGHLDYVGDDKELIAQSSRRASIVSLSLISLGVPRDRVTAKGYGKSQPIAANDTDWGRTKNRRIEVAKKDCQTSGAAAPRGLAR